MNFIRIFINNLNNRKYIKNSSFVNVTDNMNDANNLVIKSNIDSSSLLNELELDDRVNNRNTFIYATNNIFKQMLYKYIIPVCLVITSITSFFIPRKEKKINIELFEKRCKIYTNDEGLIADGKEDNCIYYDETFKKDIIGEYEYKNIQYGHNSIEVNYKVYAGIDRFNMDLVINQDGIVSRATASFDKSINLDCDLTEIDEDKTNEYQQLFDDMLDLVETQLGNSNIEKLKELSSNEKSKIVIKICEYVSLGENEVSVYGNSLIILRMISTIMTIAYILIESLEIHDKQINFDLEGNELKNIDGVLEIDEDRYERGLDLLYRYRHLFIAAEKRRIEKINEICNTRLEYGAREAILTNTEQELLNHKYKVLGRGKKNR